MPATGLHVCRQQPAWRADERTDASVHSGEQLAVQLCQTAHPPIRGQPLKHCLSAGWPQLSHDNALNANAFNLSQELYASIKQRNNCPVPLTWQAFGRLGTPLHHKLH